MSEIRWPAEPYKGLGYYDIDDTALFAGRDNDVDDCVDMLAEPRTRTILLHGRTGCGKSSFLRAGLIPALETRGSGFIFLRGSSGQPVIIRCTADPMARIAIISFRGSTALLTQFKIVHLKINQQYFPCRKRRLTLL